jgi:hypothetical protein
LFDIIRTNKNLPPALLTSWRMLERELLACPIQP